MALFKTREKKDWKDEYIRDYRQMKEEYEKRLETKQIEIERLKEEIENYKDRRSYLKPKEKQIKDSDIDLIKSLRFRGMSYREICNETRWSKATVSRVLNGMYDEV